MSLRTRVDTARRDIAWIAAQLTNRRSPPFTLTTPDLRVVQGGASAPEAAGDLFAPRTLRVAEVVRETADAVSIVLEDPAGAPIRFRSGQFLTLLVEVLGETHRRAYSIASSATDTSRVVIGVKRVDGGRVSSHLVANTRAGDVVRVLGPSGSFGPGRARGPRHLVLVGGGSGITPLMSILRTALAAEPATRVTLVYANRGPEAVVFAGALAELAAREPERFTLRHVFGESLAEADAARELEAAGAFAGLGRAGLAEAGDVATELFICGPAPMMTVVRAAIAGRGVPAERVHEERFTAAPRAASPSLAGAPTAGAQGSARVTFRVRGHVREVDVEPGQTLLEAGLAAGLPMPFSCAMGGCGACKVQVSDGEVEMDEPSCLTGDERAAGQALACVGRPCGTRLTVEAP